MIELGEYHIKIIKHRKTYQCKRGHTITTVEPIGVINDLSHDAPSTWSVLDKTYTICPFCLADFIEKNLATDIIESIEVTE